MNSIRFWGVAGTLVAAVAAGLGFLAPVAHGQVAVFRAEDAPGAGRRVEILTGRGSSIGVTVRDIRDADLGTYKLATPHGAIVEEVEEGSPAAKAGFKSGDVVVAFDGETIRSARQFSRLVDETPPGRTVKASVMRAGARTELEVTPGEGSGRMRMGWWRDPREDRGGPQWEMRVPPPAAMPDFERRLPELRMDIEQAMGRGVLGVGVTELTPELAEYFGTKGGVLVNSVRPDSAAAKAGVKPGDVITSVGGTAVANVDELRRRLREASGEVALGLVRDKKALSLKATIEKPESQRPRWPV